MLEYIVGQAGETRERLRARGRYAVDCDRVEVGSGAVAPRIGRAANDRLARSAEMLENGHAARPPARGGKQRGDAARRVAVLRQQQKPGTRRQMQTQSIDGTPVQGQGRTGLDRPAEPGGGQTERAGVRHDRHLVEGKAVRQNGADAVPQRVAARQHRDGPAAPPAISPSVSVSGRRQISRSARPGGTIARCRAPPISSSAVSIRARAAGLIPASPSSPIPTMPSQHFMTSSSPAPGVQRVDRRRRQGATATAST